MKTTEHLRDRQRRILGSSRGAFDLPSILVGVVAVGILTAGVLAAIFGIIPFAQDKGAQQDLSAVNTAQGVAKTKDGGYLSKEGLLASSLMSTTPASLSLDLNYDSTSFCAAVASPTGKSFRVTARQGSPSEGDCQPLWVRQDSLLTSVSWRSTPISLDGRTIMAAGSSGPLKISKDSGATWSTPALFTGKTMGGGAMSDDGKVMLAGMSISGVYSLAVSVDAGVSWSEKPYQVAPTTSATMARQVASTSADGRTSVVALSDGTWIVSRDFGSTWATTGPAPLASVARMSASISDDGMKIALNDYGRQLISNDSGASWTQTGSGSSSTGFFISGDGKHLYRSFYNLETSSDNGSTWTQIRGSTAGLWTMAASDNGKTLIGVSTEGAVVISKDGGATWTLQPSAKASRWESAAISGNGEVFAAGGWAGALWVGRLGW